MKNNNQYLFLESQPNQRKINYKNIENNIPNFFITEPQNEKLITLEIKVFQSDPIPIFFSWIFLKRYTFIFFNNTI